MTTRWIAAGTSAFSNAAGPARVLAQGAVPVILPPSGFFANNGVLVIGQAPNSSATVSFSATSGAGVTMTFSAGTNLLGTASDVGRVLTILDTTYKYATVTAQSSATVATVTLTGTLSGTGPFANNTIWMSGTTAAITGTAGFSSLLANVYANCWMSFPAGAIAAGVPAAQTTYFAQMTTSTLVTVFNNVLATVPNSAATPASPTAFATTGPGAYSQVTSGQTLFNVTVPANSMGANGRVELEILQGNDNSAGTKSVVVNFGGTQIVNPGASTNQSSPIRHSVTNRGVTNSQVAENVGTAGYTAGGAPVYPAIDTTADALLAMRGLIPAITDWVSYESFKVVLYPG